MGRIERGWPTNRALKEPIKAQFRHKRALLPQPLPEANQEPAKGADAPTSKVKQEKL